MTKTGTGVGSPAHLLLNAWGTLVHDAFGEIPYLVGSATTSKTWRDVDIRVMLDDDQWNRILPGVPTTGGAGFVYPRWSALCMAVSAWGQQFTGLPIDFQFQPRDHANTRYKGYREPLGIRIDPEPPSETEAGRLRAALEEIGDTNANYPDSADEMWRIAHTALSTDTAEEGTT